MALIHPPAQIGRDAEHEPHDDLAGQRLVGAIGLGCVAPLAPEVVIDLIEPVLPDLGR